MIDDEPEIDVPERWTATECRFSGNFKLIAEFEHEETGQKVRIAPYKTYTDQPGFCNAHRVTSVDPEDGVTEIAVGMEVEHIQEAKKAAIRVMKEITD
ncbi:uncharacterized protein Nmlp_2600 [Natronomonas moolapensis 8.8.11]|uniref:Uncharacterized protein n=1 Tax=Natronomonas moolapensis (strain DSM 18674 / CECT 7526 / JCM 14361 / 8.8.11) TaxID=268739 RepID=M1Y2M7_NATM8|nr:hypothetical protein [Natronomonas moolapensis]CCQ36759.1 uncharacterized protein Nmlp_2600 [Natronomonas moolapensis 8.8.11]